MPYLNKWGAEEPKKALQKIHIFCWEIFIPTMLASKKIFFTHPAYLGALSLLGQFNHSSEILYLLTWETSWHASKTTIFLTIPKFNIIPVPRNLTMSQIKGWSEFSNFGRKNPDYCKPSSFSTTGPQDRAPQDCND